VTVQSDAAVEVRGLVKAFGTRRVLRGIDLRVRQGEFMTLFGPNGAGKSTLLKVLATLSRPTSGSAHVAGRDVRSEATEVRRLIGVVPHESLLYEDLTPRENLRFYARMYDVPRAGQRIQEVVEMVGLSGRMDDRVGTLSRGMQQRLSIARALLHDPPLLLLDEPHTGLDQQALTTLRDVLCDALKRGRTIVMSTHSLDEGVRLGTHAAIMVRGRIAYEERAETFDAQALAREYERCTGARA